ncbi:MAG: methyltransferase domain-containing protein [Abyssibacter sp.]|uniref:methyltransferase domain-containing protein n=1 Tax=Abyssibacter sp. TaxID=2320200 RepID=UPI00321A4B19
MDDTVNTRRAGVQDYYGQVLQGSDDLKTNACCTSASPPRHVREALSQVHDEVLMKYYGCGLAIPDQLDGMRVLDLGSGSGRDAYVVARLVGERGSVVGIDMTPEQLAVARRHEAYHAEQWGYARPNTQFLEGDIERLDAVGLADADFDIIISNCVINLAMDKAAVLREAHRVLKPGGELYFSDIYADRRIPDALVNDPVLYGECLSGALYWNDFHHLAKRNGFDDPRIVHSEPLEILNEAVREKLGDIRFWSVTYRLFKLDGLEPACEDYGQAVRYLGSIDHCASAFDLDAHHHFPTGKIIPVCGNTWRMLADTRFGEHFEFIGDFSTHYGIFPDCGTDVPYASQTDASSGAACC